MNIIEFNKDKLIFILLLVSVVLYFSQGVLIPVGSNIGQFFLLIIYVVSFVYLLKYLFLKNNLSGFVAIWNLLIFIHIFGFLLYNGPPALDVFKTTLLNFLPFFAFYYFAQNNLLTRKVLVIVFLILLPVFIIKFNQSLQELQLEKNREEVVDNTIYLFIGLLPFTFFFRYRILSLFFLLILWYFIVLSAKRGAIICGALAIILFIVQSIYTSKSKIKLKQYVFSFILFLIISFFGYKFYQKNQYLMERMEIMMDGHTSGRDNLAIKIVNRWYYSDDMFNYLFGFGYNSSFLTTNQASHNDWIDMLICYGLIGIIIYFLLFRRLFLYIVQKSYPKDMRIILLLVFCIAVITSLTSRWYWSSFAYMQMLVIPYLLASKYKNT